MPNKVLTDGARYLVEQGISPEITAGIIANLDHESGGDPTAVGDNDTSYGLAQWHGDRAQALMDYATENGLSPKDPKAQFDFLLLELHNDPSLLNQMKGVSPEAAADLFQRRFERPAKIDPTRSDTAAGVASWMARNGLYKQGGRQTAAGIVDQAGEVVGQAGQVMKEALTPRGSFRVAEEGEPNVGGFAVFPKTSAQIDDLTGQITVKSSLPAEVAQGLWDIVHNAEMTALTLGGGRAATTLAYKLGPYIAAYGIPAISDLLFGTSGALTFTAIGQRLGQLALQILSKKPVPAAP